MSKRSSVFLEVNPKANTYQDLAKALDGVWKNERRLPLGMTIEKSSPSMLAVTVHRTAFVLEYDALAILSSPPLKLAKPFLIPPNRVMSIELKRTAQSLEIFAICRGARTVSLKEAKRLSRRNSLPPGVHDPAALLITERVKPRVVQGGLPSLGKRR